MTQSKKKTKKTVKTKKLNIEFSKILTTTVIIVCSGVAIWSTIKYYLLVEVAINTGNDILPDATLPVACITTILGAVLSYSLYQFGLKNSRNRYGVDESGQPFKTAVEYEDIEEDNCESDS